MDDESTLIKTYTFYLESQGHKVIGNAHDGDDAVKKYRAFEDKPDIILMDHRMPNKSGLEATEEILSFNNHSKIIFVSADITIKDQALKSGAISFISKPFRFQALIDEIKKAAREE